MIGSSGGHMTQPAISATEAAADAEPPELVPTLGPFHLTMIGVGGIIGAGIFVYAGTAAAEHAGPAVVASFAIAAIGCFFCGLCYAEFAAMIPQSGSAYTYAYATMGRFMAWFIGWNLVLEYLVSAAGVAAGWSGYFVSLLNDFGLCFPAAFASAPLDGTGFSNLHFTGALFNAPAVGLIAVLTACLLVGVRESANFNGLMVVIKTGIVVVVILFGLPFVHMSNLTPFLPPNTGQWGHFGISGVLAASGIAFFAYLGFDSVSVAAQEARNPQKNLPIGILASLFICTALYILMAVVLTGIADWRTLDVTNPVSFAVQKIAALRWLVLPIDLAAAAGLASVTFVSLYGQSRIFYVMARDGFLPSAFSEVHPRYLTPHIGTLIVGGFAALLAAFFPFDVLADLVSIGTLMAFAAVCVGILILRRRAPRARRAFRTPWVWLVAPAGIACCLLMMYSLSVATWIRLVLWTGIGLVFYLIYGRRRAAPAKWQVENES